jgi:GDPmannose 4,6-dehydratase
MTKQKTAVITGVTGQDGSYLSEILLERGYKVVGIKRRTSLLNSSERIDSFYSNPDFKLEYGNMTDSTSIWRILTKYQPDEIYNLAAQSHVRVSFDCPEETLEVVSHGTLKLLEAYKAIVPHAKFYQASSSEMYGDNPKYPQNESTQLMPASPYACAKVFAHNLCRNYRHSYGLHISCGILFNHESPRRGETFVTRKISQAAARIKFGYQDSFSLGNLDAKRDWGYAKDYCEGMWLMLQQENPDDYVLATNETHTVREYMEATFDLAGLDPYKYLKTDERLFRPHEVPVLLGDYTKAKVFLNWEPKVRFADLVKLMYDAEYTSLM